MYAYAPGKQAKVRYYAPALETGGRPCGRPQLFESCPAVLRHLKIPSSAEAAGAISVMGNVEAGNVEAGNVVAGNVEAGSVEAGNVEAGSVEAGNVEAGAIDAADPS